MGTAPGQQHQPVMPDADTTVSLAVKAITDLGFSTRTALGAIADTVAHCIRDLQSIGVTDVPWLTQVRDIAASRLAVPLPSSTDREDNSNADGRSSSASRDQEDQR